MDQFNEILSNYSQQDLTPLIQLFIILTFLMFLPAVVFMCTSFIRIIITFSFIKSALGAQQSIPSQVLLGVAIAMTVFIMAPTVSEINETAVIPYLQEELNFQEALNEAEKPIKDFLLRQTREDDISLFLESANIDTTNLSRDEVPLYVLAPAFAISELKTAFQIGFLIYLPFLLIDLVVASTLMAMGMMMLPPVMVSLPFKLLLFIMVDGWNLLIKSLLLSFN
ncbi:MAG: flagellar type III secretion system pore protein FliP [Peptostreptococcaceae bacterium]